MGLVGLPAVLSPDGDTRTLAEDLRPVAQTRAVAPAGSTLVQAGHRSVPPRATPRRSYRRISPDARRVVRYRVRPGDTPSAVAVRFHAWTAELVAMNGSVLRVGDRIRIPVVLRAAAQARAQGKPAQKTGQKAGQHKVSASSKKAAAKKAAKKKVAKKVRMKAAKKARKKAAKRAAKRAQRRAQARRTRALQEAAARPSRAAVRRVVARTARRHGVDPQLALAVAWQESGWQMHLTSSAGAIGAMQVIPGTGQWMSVLVGRRLDLRDLHDNATAGVVYLKLLRSQTTRPRVAVAGYYQGLAGVRRHGMYDDTKRYVANVLAIRKRFEQGRYPA